MSDITQLLQAAQGGDRPATDALLTALYADLRRLARSHMHAPLG